MEILAKGQLSFLILSCLKERDMYGLELIEEIKNRWGFDIKMPSLYSNINRMKTQRFISTYLKESLKGPKCSYSSITEKGREEYKKLVLIFGEISPIDNSKSLDNNHEDNIENQIIDTSKSLFDFKDNCPNQKTNQYEDYFADVEEIKKDSKILDDSTQKMPAANNNLDNNISIDFSNSNLHTSQKSFIENLAEIDIVLPNIKTQICENKLEECKDLLLEHKNKFCENENNMQNAEVKLSEKELPSELDNEELKNEIKTDDGKFITERLEEVPRFKPYEHSRTSFVIAPQETILPPPKRNIMFDPNCSDVKSKIDEIYNNYQPKNDRQIIKQNSEFQNYDELKKYYDAQNINFKPYIKFEKKEKHNTNKIKFYTHTLLCFIFSLLSLSMFLLFKGLSIKTNFEYMYIILPVLYWAFVGYKFYCYKNIHSKKPKFLYGPIVNSITTGVLILIIICINFVCGMTLKNILLFSPLLILPIMFVLIAYLLGFYLYRFLIKKYWK